MKVPHQLIDYYLSVVTVTYYNDHDTPPDELGGYDDFIDAMRANAERRGDLGTLKTVFVHLLSHPELDLERYAGGRYPYDDGEIREILTYAVDRIWGPGASVAPEPVELVQQSVDDYWRGRPQGAGA